MRENPHKCFSAILFIHRTELKDRHKESELKDRHYRERPIIRVKSILEKIIKKIQNRNFFCLTPALFSHIHAPPLVKKEKHLSIKIYILYILNIYIFFRKIFLFYNFFFRKSKVFKNPIRI